MDQCYVNVRDRNVATTMPSRRPLQALSVNIAVKVKAVSGGRLLPTGPKTTTRYGPKPKPLAQRVHLQLRAGPVTRVKRKAKKIDVHDASPDHL